MQKFCHISSNKEKLITIVLIQVGTKMREDRGRYVEHVGILKNTSINGSDRDIKEFRDWKSNVYPTRYFRREACIYRDLV
jgi:hypothetical protein